LGTILRVDKLSVTVCLVVFVAVAFTFAPAVRGDLPTPTLITVSRVFSVLSYDSTVYAANTSYAVAHDSLTGQVFALTIAAIGGQINYTGEYSIWKSFFYWDTSIIPDNATILNSTVGMNIIMDQSATDFNVTLQTSSSSSVPHEPVQAGDYYYGYYSGDGGSMNTSEMGGLGYFNITMNSGALSWISKTGHTKIAVRSSSDINSVAPSGNEYVEIGTYERGEAQSAKLYVTYETLGYNYFLHGAFNEDGTFNGAINVTFYTSTQGSFNITLNGDYNITTEAIPVSFRFDLGYNQSRVYYVYEGFEEIYVFKPADPIMLNYFEITDYLGADWAYLESVINVNGTWRVVERRPLTANALPFFFTFGSPYTMRLVTDKGTYVYGQPYTGEPSGTTYSLPITTDMFPSVATDISGLNVTAVRVNMTLITMTFYDANTLTDWVQFNITEATETSPIFSYNTTANTVTVNWQEAGTDEDYYVLVTVSHSQLGLRYWLISCPAPASDSSRYEVFGAIRLLGTFPFDLAQMPAILLITCVGLAFSWWHIPIGLIVQFLMACFFVWFGFVAIGWGWMSIAGSVVILLALSEAKEKEGAF
jgi:hypothetical protein